MIDSNHNYYSSSNVVLVILSFSTLEGSKLNNEIDFYHYRFTVHPKPAAFFYRGERRGGFGVTDDTETNVHSYTLEN
jgi:hypothetical protein